jgi:hypothetical protein
MMARPNERREGTLRALAQETHRSIEFIADLYDDEVARLEASSRVKKFIEVIAGRRVKERLLHM